MSHVQAGRSRRKRRGPLWQLVIKGDAECLHTSSYVLSPNLDLSSLLLDNELCTDAD